MFSYPSSVRAGGSQRPRTPALRAREQQARGSEDPSGVDTWGCCGPRRAAARAAWEQGRPGSRVGNGVCRVRRGAEAGQGVGDLFFYSYAHPSWNTGTS